MATSNFKTVKEVVIAKGGYLADATSNKPVSNKEFVAAQLRAHRLVSIAAKMKGKTFTVAKVDNIHDIVKEVEAELSATRVEEFVKVPTIKEGKLTAQLAAEAKAFVEGAVDADKANALNNRLQEFIVINDFETTGLFFTSKISKLSKIYTMKEIIAAAETVYAVLEA